MKQGATISGPGAFAADVDVGTALKMFVQLEDVLNPLFWRAEIFEQCLINGEFGESPLSNNAFRLSAHDLIDQLNEARERWEAVRKAMQADRPC